MAFDVPETHQTGRLGALKVMATFESLGIGAEGIREHDFGMDLFLHARNKSLVDLGIFATVQVKAGKSFFEKEKRAKDGTLLGWWFSSDEHHLEYWMQS